MAELSSAEDFQQHLADFCRVNSPWGQALYMVRAAIEARDKAVALRAKRELLDELEHAAAEWHAVQAPCEWKSAFNVMCDKYKDQSRCACGALKSEHTPERGCVKLFSQGPSK